MIYMLFGFIGAIGWVLGCIGGLIINIIEDIIKANKRLKENDK